MLFQAIENRFIVRPPSRRGAVEVLEPIDSREPGRHVGRVRDHQECDFRFGTRLADQVEDQILILDVDVGGRLIGQEQRRLIGQGPRDGDPLLLADGKLRRPVRGAMAQADALQELHGPLGIDPLAGKAHPQQARSRVPRMRAAD